MNEIEDLKKFYKEIKEEYDYYSRSHNQNMDGWDFFNDVQEIMKKYLHLAKE